MATNNLKGSLIKFGFYFRRLRRTALGTIVLGSCVAFAYAETDVHIESVTTSPRGTFRIDRKSTRLNSSHSQISYAVFCLKKKKEMTSQHVPLACALNGLLNPPSSATIGGRHWRRDNSP